MNPGDLCMFGRAPEGGWDGTIEHVAPCPDGHATGTVTRGRDVVARPGGTP